MGNMVIALITDFGDYYPGVMKGVIRRITDVEIIDITHSVTPQNVFEGAFLLYNYYIFFPKGTIFVAVVDPEVGSEREALVIETRKYYFISPDNGLAYPSAKKDGIKRVFRIKNEISKFIKELSTTFHGRDVFAPAAALLSKGDFEYFEEIDENRIKKIDIFDARITDRTILCRAIYIDRFGNVITNVREESIKNREVKRLYYKDTEIPMVKKYSDVEVNKPLALISSFKTLELSIREGNFAKEFGIKHGKLKLRWS